MAEKDLNTRICAALRGMDPIRVENGAFPGTPDINFTGGWIESKQVRFPVRRGPIRIPHYTPKQRAFHLRRWLTGGLVFVVLEDSDTHNTYVINGDRAAQGLGHWGRTQLIINSRLIMSPWDGASFRDFIVRECRHFTKPMECP